MCGPLGIPIIANDEADHVHGIDLPCSWILMIRYGYPKVSTTCQSSDLFWTFSRSPSDVKCPRRRIWPGMRWLAVQCQHQRLGRADCRAHHGQKMRIWLQVAGCVQVKKLMQCRSHAHFSRSGQRILPGCIWTGKKSMTCTLCIKHKKHNALTKCNTNFTISTLTRHKIVDHLDVVGASLVSTAPTTSSFST